jgi:uncharacterized repeat protein (TIGR01451 family)
MDHVSGGLAFFELPFADLSVTQSATPIPGRVGEITTLTVTVTNNGPDSFPAVSLADSVPGGSRVESIVPSQGKCALEEPTEIRCALGALAAGASATVLLELIPMDAGPATNSAAVSLLSDPDLKNNQSSLSFSVRGD